MKPILISTILVIAVVISCTVQNISYPSIRTVSKGELKPMPLKVPISYLSLNDNDTALLDTAVYPAIVFEKMDTTTLRKWMDAAYLDKRYQRSIMDDIKFQAVVTKLGQALDENEQVVKELVRAVEEKEKAQEEAEQIKNVLFNFPNYFWCVYPFFFLTLIAIIYKVHYSRLKLQAYIDGKINK